MSLGAVGLPAAAILGALFLDQPVNVVAGAGYLAVASTVFIAALRPLSAAAPQGQTLSPAAR
jgi:hypothetical protein